MDLLMESAPSPEHRALWAVMRFTGARASETLKLQWGAIHSDRIVFTASTTKTRSTREPLIACRLQEELDRFRCTWEQNQKRPAVSKDLLFPSPGSDTQHLSRQGADKALRRTLVDLGERLPSGVSLHSFRRSLATQMVQGGVSLRTMQRFTGHASVGQLQEYIDVSEADERSALLHLEAN